MSTAKRRRDRGDGYIGKRKMQRADGTAYVIWQGAIAVFDAYGIKRKRTVYGKTRDEAKAKLKALANPAPVSNGTRTVGEYLDEWLAVMHSRKAPATYRVYEYIVKTHLAPALGAINLDKLTRDDVRRMVDGARRHSKGSKPLTPRTLSHMRAVLRAALAPLVEDGMLPRNVAAGSHIVPKQRDTREDRVYLTPDQVNRLMDVAEAKDDRLRALYLAAVRTGARQGELLGLVWSDVDFGRGYINIKRQLQRVGPKDDTELKLRPLKTESSQREVRMSAPLAAALLAHKDRQDTERLLAAGRWQAAPDFVFRTTLGTGLEGVNVTKLFQATVKAAKLPAMRFHDLRHTCASIMLAAGVKPLVVSHQLGHGSVTLTLNTYGHKMPSQDTEAADAMDRALAIAG